MCNPLDSPHHAKADDSPPFREGVVVDKAAKKGRCLVDVGLRKEVQVEQRITAGMRVTVKMAAATGACRSSRGSRRACASPSRWPLRQVRAGRAKDHDGHARHRQDGRHDRCVQVEQRITADRCVCMVHSSMYVLQSFLFASRKDAAVPSYHRSAIVQNTAV